MPGEPYNLYRTRFEEYWASGYSLRDFELAQIGPQISWIRRLVRWAREHTA